MAASLLTPAQVRTYSDNASKTFIIGLDSYFFGESGTLDFRAGGKEVTASLVDGTVSVGGEVLSRSDWDSVIGIHDFTGDREPELVVARRSEKGLSATVYTLGEGRWEPVGRMEAPDAKEIRVFRQVVTIRQGETLCTWTWHDTRFDFKSSDNSAEPRL